MKSGYYHNNSDKSHSSYYNVESNHGLYQYMTLDELVNTFLLMYVGENKMIGKVDRNEVFFFGRRALQELSYDTLRSKKDWEFELDNRMYIPMPHDFVGYAGVYFSDSAGIKRPLYPARDTSNPFRPKVKISDTAGEAVDRNFADQRGQDRKELDDWWETVYSDPATKRFIETGVAHDNTDDVAGPHISGNNYDSAGNLITQVNSTTNTNYSNTNSNETDEQDFDYNDGFDDIALGQRYGLDPEHAQINGSYFMDYNNGRIYFSPSLIGKTIVLDYVTDGLADGGDSLIHKFAEEAFYKHIAYSIVSTGSNYSPAAAQMLKKERFAETRKAKLRLSNLKSTELTQVMRGKSKVIKK